MANDIRIKRRSSGSPGAPTSLLNAELAFNEVDNTLYYGEGTGGAGGTATQILAIAGDVKANVESPTFTGTPSAPTPPAGNNSTRLATTAFVQSAVTAGAVSDGDKGDIVVTGSGSIWTIEDDAVTNAKLADMPTATIKGRTAAGTGDAQDLTTAQVRTMLSINNVDNTSDANKPISTATQNALNAKVNTSSVGAANGVAPLGADSKVPAVYLPSYVDDVLEFPNLAGFPTTGETGILYVALDTGFIYRWSGTSYIRIAASPGTTDDVPEGTINLYYTDARARTAVISNTITDGVTDRAPSSDAVFDGLAGKQDADATLTALAGVSFAANQGLYSTGADAFATYTLTAGGRALGGVAGTANTFPYFSAANVVTLGSITAAGRALLDDANVAAQRTTLGATTVGANLFTLPNSAGITFPRFNADNTVSSLNAADFRAAIGAGTGDGTVTSVAMSGGTTGLTFTGGPVTTAGTFTAGGVLALANGGTGANNATTARTNLGLGTMAIQNANAVSITGGTIDNIVIDGGTF